MAKLVIQLPRPTPASQDCLPHAAMNLGAPRAGGMRPPAGIVHALVLEEQLGNWVLYRLDDRGGFVGDTWHGTREDALWQIKKEFGIDAAAPVGARHASPSVQPADDVAGAK